MVPSESTAFPSTDQTNGTTVGTTYPMIELTKQLRIDHLRALLVCHRIQKAGLSAEISTASTTPERKKGAINRYAEVIHELRKIERQLEQIRG